MTLALVVFAIAVSSWLVGGAWAIDGLLRPVRLPTRFAWGAAMLGIVGLVALALVRSTLTPSLTASPARLVAVDIFAFDAALSGATRTAAGILPGWLEPVWLVCWMLTSLLALVYFIGGALRHRQVMSAAVPALVAGQHVRVSDDFGPAVIGVLRSQVVLPRWLLTRSIEEQSLVVAHERSHIAVRDPLLLIAGVAAVVAMPWNPIIWWAYSRLRLAMELDCDARVLRAGARPHAYGALLLDLTTALPPARLGAPAFAARPSQLEARILHMSTRPSTKRHRGAAIAAAALTGMIVTIAACSADVSDLPSDPKATPVAISQPSVGPTAVNAPYFDFQVEKSAQPLPLSRVPKYPPILRSAGVEGEVLAQFVVDTLGTVEIETFKVVRKTHDLFEASLREVLPEMRFSPAELGGKKVRQLVQQPFVFQLAR